MRILRTYPQPDSPEPHLGPRERALAVFKYLLDLEPEAARDHPLFACVEHSYENAVRCGFKQQYDADDPEPSLVPMLTSERTIEPDVPLHFVADEGKL